MSGADDFYQAQEAVMSDPADFHCLRARLRLQGILTTRTALRIGSGDGGVLDGVDLPVLKDARGMPFIPGASLKGALRSTIEALVRGAGPATDSTAARLKAAGLWTCDPLAQNAAQSDSRLLQACGHHEAKERDKVKTKDHCALCRLFGSHVLASHVRVGDALLVRPERPDSGEPGGAAPSDFRPPVEIRDGVAIDRDLKTASNGKKYDFEVVSPGVRFALEIVIDNPRKWLMGLFAMGIEQLNQGFTALGGFTSRGLGRVDIAWSSLTQFTAEGLLAGREPEVLEDQALTATIKSWQEALAQYAAAIPGAGDGAAADIQGGH